MKKREMAKIMIFGIKGSELSPDFATYYVKDFEPVTQPVRVSILLSVKSEHWIR